MTSKPGRPLDRPRLRSSIVGHPGASSENGEPAFSSSPRSPLLHNGAQERWPIDADAPWKSHGRLRRTARTEPSTAFSTELGKPATGCRFSTSVNRPAALRSVVFARLFSSLRTDTGSIINPSTKSGQVQRRMVAPRARCAHSRNRSPLRSFGHWHRQGSPTRPGRHLRRSADRSLLLPRG